MIHKEAWFQELRPLFMSKISLNLERELAELEEKVLSQEYTDDDLRRLWSLAIHLDTYPNVSAEVVVNSPGEVLPEVEYTLHKVYYSNGDLPDDEDYLGEFSENLAELLSYLYDYKYQWDEEENAFVSKDEEARPSEDGNYRYMDVDKILDPKLEGEKLRRLRRWVSS